MREQEDEKEADIPSPLLHFDSPVAHANLFFRFQYLHLDSYHLSHHLLFFTKRIKYKLKNTQSNGKSI